MDHTHLSPTQPHKIYSISTDQPLGKTTLTHFEPFSHQTLERIWAGEVKGPSCCYVNKKEASPAGVRPRLCVRTKGPLIIRKKRGLGLRVDCRRARQPAAAAFLSACSRRLDPTTIIPEKLLTVAQLTGAPAPSWYVIRSPRKGYVVLLPPPLPFAGNALHTSVLLLNERLQPNGLRGHARLYCFVCQSPMCLNNQTEQGGI